MKEERATVLVSRGIYAIFDSNFLKKFVLFCCLVVALGLIAVFLMEANPLPVVLISAVAVILLFVGSIRGRSGTYELRGQVIVYQTCMALKSHVKSSPSLDEQVRVWVTVSALCNLRLEQTAYEKAHDIGRLYFDGTPKLDAERPLDSDEERWLKRYLKSDYALYGVRNFAQVRATLEEIFGAEQIAPSQEK